MAYRKANRKVKRKVRRVRRTSSALTRTIARVSKRVALQQQETKRKYITVTGQFDATDAGTHYYDMLTQILQAQNSNAGFEDRRIGNQVTPCWLKGFIMLTNIHHGTFDFTKNYSIRVMILRDRLNIINDGTIPASAFPIYRQQGQTAPVTGALVDHCQPIDYRAWQVMMDKQYNLYQQSSFTAGHKPFLRIPISVNLTKCKFDFDRGTDQLVDNNIALFISARSFDGTIHSSVIPVKYYYDLTLSFKDA